MRHIIIALCLIILAACSSSSDENTPVPTSPPSTPTSEPTQEANAVVTPEVFAVAVAQEGLLDFNGVADGRVELIYSGVEDAHFRSGNAIPYIEVTHYEEDGNISTPDRYTPEHYIIKISTGETLERIRMTIFAFNAELESGVYPITGTINQGFQGDSVVLGYIQGQGAELFNFNPQGFLQIVRDGDTVRGSLIMTIANTALELQTVQAAFGSINLGE